MNLSNQANFTAEEYENLRKIIYAVGNGPEMHSACAYIKEAQALYAKMAQSDRGKPAGSNQIRFIHYGDFYETRGENAVFVANLLDLTITTDEITGEKIATIPEHRWIWWANRLVQQGYEVVLSLAPSLEK